MLESVHEIKISISCSTENERRIRLRAPCGTGLLNVEPWTRFLSRGSRRVFQDMNVFDILDVVFGSHVRRGCMAPSWRFDVAERASYPKRRLTAQHEESDLSFVERLMLEEGLSCFFEQSNGVPGQSSYTHTMVISDHNGAFQPADQDGIESARRSAS